MNNYKLIIQYDGTDYSGWQVQKNAVSVQQKIIDSITLLLKEKVNLVGAGRTDTGVHAIGQTANFRTELDLDLYKFKYQLNSVLPKDISIIEITSVHPEFHARFDAKKRSYLYLITDFKSPFLNRYSCKFNGTVDIKKLNELGKTFLGEHNFTSFSKKNSETVNKICNIYSLHWKTTKGITIFYIEADRFLHGMVRSIVGTLIRSVKTELNPEAITQLIAKKDRDSAGEAVPGCGLFLYKVKY